jgi:hypothetical protein
MDGTKINSGYSLLEALCLLVLMQVIFCWLSPSFKSWLQNYRCRQTTLELQKIIAALRVTAVLRQESQKLDLLRLRQENISWQGLLKGKELIFQPNSVANRLNGYFTIQCSPYFGYRLWLNRLGYSRIEDFVI